MKWPGAGLACAVVMLGVGILSQLSARGNQQRSHAALGSGAEPLRGHKPPMATTKVKVNARLGPLRVSYTKVHRAPARSTISAKGGILSGRSTWVPM